MGFPATPGWVLLPVVVGVPRYSWLRVLVAAPRHSWLGSAGCGRRVPCRVCLWCEWFCMVIVLLCVSCVCGVCVVGGVVWWCGVGVSSVCAGLRGCVCVV